MTNIYWPENLPEIRASGFNAQYSDPVIRTKMDAGPTKQRLRYTAVPKQITCFIIVNEEERKILEEWYVQTLGHGTLRFVMKNPATAEWEEFRFTKPYSEVGTEGYFEIALSLERLP